MNQPTNGELKIMQDELVNHLKDVKENVKEGFKQVDQRFDRVEVKQDFTNGKVRSHTVWIAGVIGGAMVVFFLFASGYFFRIIADEVVDILADRYSKIEVID